jgi:hypothetical protein
MTRRRSSFILIVQLLLFAVAVTVSCRAHAVWAAADDAIYFRGTTLSGKTILPETLFEGRPLAVLTFFGVNCIPCQKKIVQLNALWRNERLRECAVFYAINADGFNAEKLEKEIARRGIRIDFPVIPDEKQAITNLYVNGIVPMTVVIDKDFRVVLSTLGARPEMIKKLEDRILAQGKESAK